MKADDIIHDLEERVRELTEENARLAESVIARDNFLSFAAHELRNPMTPLISRVALLRRAAEQGGLSQEKLLEGLKETEGLLSRFVKRATTLLDVSRMTSGQLRLELQDVDLREIAIAVASTFEPQTRYLGTSLKVDVQAGTLDVMGDRLAIEEVLDNLVSNAIKYGNGEPVLLSIVTDVPDRVAHIEVKDGGPGISPEDRARIFERFERAVPKAGRASGFGIGLWIVKQLVEAMHGTIAVESTPGEGSTFRVTLPLMLPKEVE